MAEKQVVTITIVGTYKTGKSAIAILLRDALEQHGISVDIDDIDGPPVRTVETNEKCLKEISHNVTVNVVVKQIPFRR